MKNAPSLIRPDHKAILEFIKPGARVLDLGCGDGALLDLLIQEKACRGEGIEIDENMIYKCLEKGLTVCHEDINTSLVNYPDKRFDYIILHESLQQVLHPQKTILEALRIGKQVIVGIPNFCHILARVQLFFLGRVPITRELPYQWYDTPNLRFFSLKDFQAFCRKNHIVIKAQRAMGAHREIFFLKNVFAHIGIFLLEKP